MGSYLSILNDTDDVWAVKLGPDQQAIQIALIAAQVVSTVDAAVASAGAALPALAASGVVSVCGVSDCCSCCGKRCCKKIWNCCWYDQVNYQSRSTRCMDRLAPGEKK